MQRLKRLYQAWSPPRTGEVYRGVSNRALVGSSLEQLKSERNEFDSLSLTEAQSGGPFSSKSAANGLNGVTRMSPAIANSKKNWRGCRILATGACGNSGRDSTRSAELILDAVREINDNLAGRAGTASRAPKMKHDREFSNLQAALDRHRLHKRSDWRMAGLSELGAKSISTRNVRSGYPLARWCREPSERMTLVSVVTVLLLGYANPPGYYIGCCHGRTPSAQFALIAFAICSVRVGVPSLCSIGWVCDGQPPFRRSRRSTSRSERLSRFWTQGRPHV